MIASEYLMKSEVYTGRKEKTMRHSKFLNIQPQGVSNRWTRLFHKIYDNKSYKNMDDFIADI